jgi:hypothetical protein
MSNEEQQRTRRAIADQGQAEHRSLSHVATQFVDAYATGAGTTAGAGTIVVGAKLVKDAITKKEPPKEK